MSVLSSFVRSVAPRVALAAPGAVVSSLLRGSLVAGALVVAACDTDTETKWDQYNADDNTVDVQVGTTCDPSPCDPVETTLTSNTGAVEVGSGTVDPGGGPIGTLHTVEVVVSDDYAEDVGRVTVKTDSGDRGTDEYDLVKDSTGEGYWTTEIESVGEEGEVRTDTLTFRLYQEVE
jgi:hypothetical protein